MPTRGETRLAAAFGLATTLGLVPAEAQQQRSPVAAQAHASAAPAGGLVFGADSSLVVLSATAVDGKGRPVQNLRAGDFRIFEDGQRQPLARFSQSHDLQARVLLLVDASGSMNAARKSATVRAAAEQVLATLAPDDEAALAGFDSEYWTEVPFTRDRARLRSGLDEMEPFGTTALHDALDRAATEVAAQGEGRRAVVVITDGADTASRRTPAQVLERSRALDVPIYALSVVAAIDDPASSLYTGRERPVPAQDGLARLRHYALLSGGAAYVVSDAAGLRRAALGIAGELKHQYRLGYEPPEGPARFRRILVRSTRKGVFVRTRAGYVPPS